jgi:predicted Zn-dependent peptidase
MQVPRARTSTLLAEEDGSIVRRTELPGGLRIITERVPGVRSATFGIWVAAGSRDEPARQMGSAHYLEHLLFKGTRKRNALEISSAIEAVGGDLNAFTTKEYTCYYARVLDRDLPLAIDVISDVVLNAVIANDDVEAERGVILEEIAMHDDEPSDLVHDAFARQIFGDTPLGRPILGTIDTIASLTPAAIRRFYSSRYHPSDMVIAVAGNIDHGEVVRALRRAFGSRIAESDNGTAPRKSHRVRPSAPSAAVIPRVTEQANLVLGVPGIRRGDDRKYALALLSTALGGGMSSRLFQEIREKRGLAYSVYSYAQGFIDAGLFGVYVGCLPGKVETVLDVCQTELAQVAQYGLTADEMERSKGQMRGATVLGQEDTGARMTRIAKAELHGEPLLSIQQLIDRVDAITPEQVHELAAELMSTPPTLTIIGPFDEGTRFSAVA